jgi:RNA polymerase sigma-70 factor (ECF subfamily)
VIEYALLPMAARSEVTPDSRLRGMVEAHLATVWRALVRLGVPEAGADDGVQQVFLVASRRLHEIHEGDERRYLLGIALRVASGMRRTLRRRREVSMDAAVDSPSESMPAYQHPDELLDSKRALAMLAACLDGMPEKLREAFVLFELEELSAPEVARVLGVPIGTVASRVRLARDHIRKTLGTGGAP